MQGYQFAKAIDSKPSSTSNHLQFDIFLSALEQVPPKKREREMSVEGSEPH